MKIVQGDKLNLAMTEVETRALPFTGEVKELKFDPKGNFFLIVTDAGDGKNKLVILEKDTLRLCAEVPDVSGGIDVDNVGNIYFVDHERHLRMANTNFGTFDKGGLEKARLARVERLRALKERLAGGLALPDVGRATAPQDESEDSLLRELTKKLNTLLDPMIVSAASIADIDELSGRIAALKQSDDWREHPEAFAAVEQKIAAKKKAR